MRAPPGRGREMEDDMPDRKLLLSIDGGGIRGIIPICMLIRLEEVTGKPAKETFAFVAGTSTGSIIAASIAAGIPARTMLNLYTARANEVFPQRPWNFLKQVVLGYMYSSEKLHEVLADESGPARTWTLNDVKDIDILVTAKRVDDGMPWYYVKDNPKNSQRTGKLHLLDCITASAVAPTYFKPWDVAEPNPPPGHRPAGKQVDGGVGVAGNPVYQACVEAFWYTDKYSPVETTVISLGTGRFESFKDPGGLFAIIPWVKWTLGELLDSANEQQTDLVQRHFPDMPFYRLSPDMKALDPTLDHGIGQDEIKEIPRLKTIGERFAATIDWEGILSGTNTQFLITHGRTLPRQYQTA